VNTPRTKFTALGAVLAATAGLAACGGSVTPSSVVSVGGTPISQNQFDHWLVVAAASSTASPTGAIQQIVVPQPPDFAACVAQQKATAPKPAKGQKAETVADFRKSCSTEYDSLGSQVLSFLISSQWVLSEARGQHVSVTPAAVIKEYNTEKNAQFKTKTAFANFLKSSAQTQADLLFRVRLNLLSNKLRTKVTKAAGNIGTAAIASYYAAHKDQYGTPAQRNLLLILTKTAAQANAAKTAIQKGTPFATVAKADSIDTATRAQGGVLNGVSQGTEEKALDTAVFSAPLSTLEGPVSTPFGFYVFEVTKSTPSTQKTLAQVSPTIKAQLASTAQNTALTGFVNAFQKRWRLKTTCRLPFVTPFMLSSYCGNVKVPKASAAAAASAAGSSAASGAAAAAGAAGAQTVTVPSSTAAAGASTTPTVTVPATTTPAG
jgi:foldase protein PrsA